MSRISELEERARLLENDIEADYRSLVSAMSENVTSTRFSLSKTLVQVTDQLDELNFRYEEVAELKKQIAQLEHDDEQEAAEDAYRRAVGRY